MSYTDQNFETAASHTPGPWRTAVCPSDRTPLVKAGTLTVCSMAEGDENEHLADQRLIAAAPDMLGELRNIVDNAWQYDDDAEEPDGPWTISNETYQRIAALVAKATGK